MIHRVEQRIRFGERARIQRFFHLVKAVDAMLSRGFDNGQRVVDGIPMPRIETPHPAFTNQPLKRIKAGKIAGKHPIRMKYHRGPMAKQHIARKQGLLCREKQAHRIFRMARKSDHLKLRRSFKGAKCALRKSLDISTPASLFLARMRQAPRIQFACRPNFDRTYVLGTLRARTLRATALREAVLLQQLVDTARARRVHRSARCHNKFGNSLDMIGVVVRGNNGSDA